VTDWLSPATLRKLAADKLRKAEAQSTDLPIFAPHNGTETSKAAADGITKAEAKDRRDRIVAALEGAVHGLTRAELVGATGLKENSVNSACNACVQLGLVVEDPAWVRDGRKVVYHPSLAPVRQAVA
jgi:hypothetical protein